MEKRATRSAANTRSIWKSSCHLMIGRGTACLLKNISRSMDSREKERMFFLGEDAEEKKRKWTA
ncbi:hypothetical protein LR48_Vigan432s002600 [Vigna angularis]|uniref:Uncharacterized protein n=1 Tax=Phaseolus angularis TaxID=3914 RepID=A0A0L9TAW9_PHAAN|nr:hypothetical protein LR48_Vigan432s002600 [Vigna angularis]